MSRPASNPFADEVYASLEPLARFDADLGWPLLHLCIGLSLAWDRPERWCRSIDGYPAASQVLDVDRCPVELLPWLGQFVGVDVRDGQTDPEMRAQIRDEAGFRRGTPEAMVAAVKQTLTGTQMVTVFERYGGDPVVIRVVTDPAETPNAAQTARRVLEAKAAGLVLEHTVLTDTTYGTAEGLHATYGDAESAWSTYGDAETT